MVAPAINSSSRILDGSSSAWLICFQLALCGAILTLFSGLQVVYQVTAGCAVNYQPGLGVWEPSQAAAIILMIIQCTYSKWYGHVNVGDNTIEFASGPRHQHTRLTTRYYDTMIPLQLLEYNANVHRLRLLLQETELRVTWPLVEESSCKTMMMIAYCLTNRHQHACRT